ncbi:MAG: Calx-beta domain-containing protein [bacterium]
MKKVIVIASIVLIMGGSLWGNLYAGGLNITPMMDLYTSEKGDIATFDVSLTSEPECPFDCSVTVVLYSSNANEGYPSPYSLMFTTSNWDTDQTVTVIGVDDDIEDGDQSFNINLQTISSDPNYHSLTYEVPVTNIDNDAGLIIRPTGGLITNEDGDKAILTVRLTRSPAFSFGYYGYDWYGEHTGYGEYGAYVEIEIYSTDETEGSVDPNVITFTAADWNIDQYVTVIGINDEIADGEQDYSIVLALLSTDDPLFDLDPDNVTATNYDNDPGFMVAPPGGLLTTENGGTAAFTIRLTSQPVGTVEIGIYSSDSTEGVVDAQFIQFDEDYWNVEHLVRVTGMNDDIADGDQDYAITLSIYNSYDQGYGILDPNEIWLIKWLTNRDDDEAGFHIAPESGLFTTEAGGTAVFSVRLTSQPVGYVEIDLSTSDPMEGAVAPQSLIFDANNWYIDQFAIVTGIDDVIQDGNQDFTIFLGPSSSTNDPRYFGLDPHDVSVVNRDDDFEEMVLLVEPGIMRMISFVLWPYDPSAISVFGNIVSKMYSYKKLFKIGTYDPMRSAYIEYGGELIVEPGRAYWCFARSGLNIAFNGEPVSLEDDFDVELLYDSNTGDGWNMIACPNRALYRWDNLEILEYDQNGSLVYGPTPIIELAIENRGRYIYELLLWKWQNGTYAYYDPDPNSTYINQRYERISDPYLRSSNGYWVRVVCENVYLRFPYLAQENEMNPKYLGSVPLTESTMSQNTGSSSLSRNEHDPYNDTPPAPPGGFGLQRGDLFTEGIGCFLMSAISDASR